MLYIITTIITKIWVKKYYFMLMFICALCSTQPLSSWSFFGFLRTPEPEQHKQQEAQERPELSEQEEQELNQEKPEEQEGEFEYQSTRLYTPITILLHPEGDAQTKGRTIDDSFERSLTLQCAQQIKARLEACYAKRNVRIMLTRFAGDILEPLQTAQFANRLPVDLYMSLHFYASKQVPHPVYFYYFTYLPDLTTVQNSAIEQAHELVFYPYYQAHIARLPQTQQYLQVCSQAFEKAQKEHKLVCQSVRGLPFKPLLGFTIPAFACEMGIHKKDDWKNLVEPLTSALGMLIDQLQTESAQSHT